MGLASRRPRSVLPSAHPSFVFREMKDADANGRAWTRLASAGQSRAAVYFPQTGKQRKDGENKGVNRSNDRLWEELFKHGKIIKCSMGKSKTYT